VTLIVATLVGNVTLLMRVLTACMGVASLVDVFLYKRRLVQAMVCVLVMAVGIVYYILLAVDQPLLDWTHAMPLLGIVLVFLARKGILHDEKLVRSLDRIR